MASNTPDLCVISRKSIYGILVKMLRTHGHTETQTHGNTDTRTNTGKRKDPPSVNRWWIKRTL
jgi:hypothetical protein